MPNNSPLRAPLETGLPQLDSECLLDPGRAVSLVGKTGAGKTSLAIGMIARNLSEGPVLVSFQEFSSDDILRKVLAAEGHAHANLLRPWLLSAAEKARVDASLARLKEMPLHIMEGSSLAHLRASIARVKPVLVVIDSMEFYIPPAGWKGTRRDYADKIENEFCSMTREYRTVFLVVGPHNRDGSSSATGVGISEATDAVWEIDRDDDRTTLTVSKNRMGMFPIRIGLSFDPKTRTLQQ